MDELWQLVSNQLNGSLGPGAFILLFAIIFVPIFFLIKMLASRSKGIQISAGAGDAEAMIRSAMSARPLTGAPVAAQSSEGVPWTSASTFTPARSGEAVQPSATEIAEVIQGLGGLGPARPTIFKQLPFLLIALVVGVTVLARVRTLPIGVFVITLISFVGVATFISRMRRLGQMMSAGGLNRNVTITINHQMTGVDPTIIKMDPDSLQKARGLLSAGMNIDAVCREINPAYASWGMIEQGLFRKVIEAALRQQGAGGITTPSI
jgi:hypothetical protein